MNKLMYKLPLLLLVIFFTACSAIQDSLDSLVGNKNQASQTRSYPSEYEMPRRPAYTTDTHSNTSNTNERLDNAPSSMGTTDPATDPNATTDTNLPANTEPTPNTTAPAATIIEVPAPQPASNVSVNPAQKSYPDVNKMLSKGLNATQGITPVNTAPVNPQ